MNAIYTSFKRFEQIWQKNLIQWIKKNFLLTTNKLNNKSLWAVAWMSLFSGTASVMVFSVLSLFMTEELHLSYKQVGYIESVAIAAAFLTKIFSGIISDFLGHRKSMIIIGSFCSIIIKPMFALASGVMWIFTAKSLDRLAKGIRAAPTDAMIADLSQESHEGISYGIRYAFYAMGFTLGGLASFGIMTLTHNNFRCVFWLSLVPAFLSFLILLIYVKEPLKISNQHSNEKSKKYKWVITDIKKLPVAFWHLIGVTFLLMLARFSESFLHYRGRELGFEIAIMPFLMILYNLIEAIIPMPMGKLADRFDRRYLLFWGIMVLVLANGILLVFPNKCAAIISISLAGLHMGMTQGLIGTLIASSTLPHLKGTSFSIFYLTIGIAASLGNFIAGHLSEFSSTRGQGVLGAFVWGFIITCIAALYLQIWIYSTKYKIKK